MLLVKNKSKRCTWLFRSYWEAEAKRAVCQHNRYLSRNTRAVVSFTDDD